MITIDISAMRSPRRETPAVYFRRTDADRRPARIVRRPNDGPGDLREAFARDLRDKATAKTLSVEKTAPTYVERVEIERQKRRIRILSALAARPLGLNLLMTSQMAECSADAANKLMIGLEELGFIHRTTGSYAAGGRLLLSKITDAGLAYLAGESR